ncbi:gliding motility-associated ABC transporter ATP-binding subunit GldA [Myroides odoratus]|jgi:ABC-2 type transport system ATP-binding protein|uniref:Gliding motility-associated ABC transporter ATP-binding subunit GldA n=1 Tax=Myroides odoratus TaxID=256 RepID=A0A9Q6ZBH6_MYROD|nr:gliding motility-associated ABC transporter ATP-binding subunit GldA [Myroides odoratus]MDH6601643.1 ABC-2 type transport system ATP-binding protein [Myroides gitamensis]EHQ43197.1 protein involved in gliding motility GldA [Myroides odoratus DSM 2801]EKB06582.1 gliding motility-associated ABC transporter ATP-binding subunit GldA [Myroides odoratus CIP 103059]MCS4237618.1 ABC-2 type transport system ATP-binding protein [Myroides odoratus]MDR0224168.1 gliding motility-associated ABC transport
MSIKVENISKYYGEQQALSAISFTVPKGQIVGFLGPNGAGKSTLMKILTTFIHSDEGVAYVNEYNVATQAKKVQQSIGYLPEHNPLYLDMYVREYLQFNASIYKTKKERIEEVITLTGLTPEAHKKIGQLSKGYRQRVGIATALLHDPEVLILDEPTTGLDPNQLVEIRELIKTVGKDKTVFLSTHIMQEVEAICERVIIIKKGHIVADQFLHELLDNQHEQIIAVEFDFKIEIEFVNRIPHLIKANHVHDTQWELVFPTDQDYRATVYDFAQQQGLKTLSLQPKNKNLEKLFHEFTTSE